MPAPRPKSRALAGLLAAGATFLTAAVVWPQELSYSLPEARAIAMQAAMTGRADVAMVLGEKLLAQDDRDAEALLAVATAQLSMGDWTRAYKSGRRAFRFAQADSTKFQAARLNAVAALAEDRTTVTQFWLRRAGDLAPTEVQRAQVHRNYKILQAKNPWRYRFDASIMPSSNVNGGSDSAYNIIDGVPLVGVLSPSAQALSGVIAQANTALSYRLRENAQSLTHVTGSLYLKQVELSDEARAAAPGFEASSLAATSVELGLLHTIALDEPGEVVRLHGGVRDYWQGGDRAYTAVLGDVYYRRALGKNLAFSGLIGAEQRAYAAGGEGHITTANLGLTYAFASGNTLRATLQLRDSNHPVAVFDNRSVYGKLTYALAEPVKSVKLSAGIGMSLTDYPDYSIGFIPVPGGRQDEGLFIDLDATFTGIEYAGFSPSLRVRRQNTSSNVSRFDTSEWAVSVGIKSSF